MSDLISRQAAIKKHELSERAMRIQKFFDDNPQWK